jgi:hypothetical protein
MKYLKNLLLIACLRLRIGEGNVCGEWQIGDTVKGTVKHDFFGSAVATSADGQIFAIGAPRGGSSVSTRNSYVKIFKYDPSTKKTEMLGTNYQIVPRTEQNSPVERAGSSISLSADGKVIAIADIENKNPSENDNSITLMSGGVSVYVLDVLSDGSEEWRQIGKRVVIYGGLLQTTASVKLSGDGTTFIFASSGSGVGVHGKIKTFKYNPVSNEWVQKGVSINEKSLNKFISDEVSVSISRDGNIIAVGSSKNSDVDEFSGRVRVFNYLNNSWLLRGGILSGSGNYEQFGSSVDLSEDGNTLAVGSVGSGDSTGKVGVFKYDVDATGQWVQVGADIVGPGKNSYFGASIAISSTDDSTILAIGAYGDYDSKGSASVYHFGVNGGWVQVGESIVGSGDSHFLGASVALSSDGKKMIVGSPMSGHIGLFSGSASIVELTQETCSPTSAPSAQPSLSASPTISHSPSTKPTLSHAPSSSPTNSPTSLPSTVPSISQAPSSFPTSMPSGHPTSLPTTTPTKGPTALPSRSPTLLPSSSPTKKPSSIPTSLPTSSPSRKPSSAPTSSPSSAPTNKPSSVPSSLPTSSPSRKPSSAPTSSPTTAPSMTPTSMPTDSPTSTQQPSLIPSGSPTDPPSSLPSVSHSPTVVELLDPNGALSAGVSSAVEVKISSVFLITITALATVIITFF